jgi:hypothetical protein
VRHRIDPSQWTTHNVRGRVYEICTSTSGETVVLGVPDDPVTHEEEHNCDANGCGQDHVLWRGSPLSGSDLSTLANVRAYLLGRVADGETAWREAVAVLGKLLPRGGG